MAKRIVILGGGVGGLVTANRLKSRLKGNVEVLLVDQRQEHIYAPSFLWLMIGKRTSDQICRNLSLLNRKGIDTLFGQVTAINPERKSLAVGPEEILYDYLIVALGADLAPDKILGLKEAAYNLYDLEGVRSLQPAIAKFTGGKVGILIAGIPFKCPAAPYEAAFLIDSFLSERDVRKKTTIEVITPEPLPMPTAGPDVGNALKGMLEARGIVFNGQQEIKSIDVKSHGVALKDDNLHSFDLLIAIPPHQPPPVVVTSLLSGSAGWIPVDAGTLATQYEGVYALGDVVTIPLQGRFAQDKPLALPRAGIFAHYQADVVAHNIANQINGRGVEHKYKGNGW